MDPKPSERLTADEQVKLFRRALAAYYADPETTGWPSTESMRLRRIGGLNYVVLVAQEHEDDDDDDYDVLACYRVRHDGKLKRLSRLPERLV